MGEKTVSGTMKTFGYPESLIRQYEHWAVLLRPKQATLGALVLAARYDSTAFSDLPAEAHAELSSVTKDIEAALTAAVGYQKINYLMLMMVDPEVHFHVLPRYAEDKTFEGLSFPDRGWPAIPQLADGPELGEVKDRLIGHLKSHWRQG